jgi:hypothetical protein
VLHAQPYAPPNTVRGEVEPSRKARALAEGVSEAMNCGTFALLVAVIGVMGIRAARPPWPKPEAGDPPGSLTQLDQPCSDHGGGRAVGRDVTVVLADQLLGNAERDFVIAPIASLGFTIPTPEYGVFWRVQCDDYSFETGQREDDHSFYIRRNGHEARTVAAQRANQELRLALHVEP